MTNPIARNDRVARVKPARTLRMLPPNRTSKASFPDDNERHDAHQRHDPVRGHVGDDVGHGAQRGRPIPAQDAQLAVHRRLDRPAR